MTTPRICWTCCSPLAMRCPSRKGCPSTTSCRIDRRSCRWEQSRFIAGLQLTLAWEHFVYGEFQRMPSSTAMRRRREVTLALGRVDGPVRKKEITDLSPGLARSYAEKTRKTLTRDMNWLVKRGFLEKVEDGYRAKVETMRAFRPARHG